MDSNELILELLRDLRSKDERIQQLSDMMLGISPSVNLQQQQDGDMKPIHRKSQFRQLITFADKANRDYWKQQAERAEEEVRRAHQEREAVRSSGSDVSGESKGSDANGSGTGNDGQNASQEKTEICQGVSEAQIEEMIGGAYDQEEPGILK